MTCRECRFYIIDRNKISCLECDINAPLLAHVYKMRDGLIGNCTDFKERLEYEK